MAWQLVSCEVVRGKKKIRALIERFKKMEKFKSKSGKRLERPLREKRVGKLKAEFDRGSWRAPDWREVHCDGKDIEVDGQHSVELLDRELDKMPDDKAVVIHHKYRADTMLDAADLYGTLDSPVNRRTAADYNRFVAGSLPRLSVVKREESVNLALIGALQNTEGSRYSQTLTAKERSALIINFIPFIIWHYKTLYKPNTPRKRVALWARGGAAAAMYVIFNDDPDRGAKFVEQVRDASHENPDSISRQLNEYLRTCVKTSTGGRYDSSKLRVDLEDIKYTCLKAWEIWKDDENSTAQLSRYRRPRKKKKEDEQKDSQ